MARSARSLRAEGMLDPGRLYHVTNRGVDRMNIFGSDLDRIVFLSILAEACDRTGALCHAWTLMSNHFHLVVEDSRGLLSQLLHRLEFCYARFFNDSRGRTGPLFEHRFADELIDSPAYFEDACAYVLLNPVRTAVPMAPNAESYAWSSARLVTADTTCKTFGASLLDRVGGLEAVMVALGTSARKATLELRRKRLEVLAAGRWMERDALLGGRSSEAYRLLLAAKAGNPTGAEPLRGTERIERASTNDGPSHGRRVWPIRSRSVFAGLEISAVREEIERMCDRVIPATLLAAGRAKEIFCFALYRFSSATEEELGTALGTCAEAVWEMINRVQLELTENAAWRRLVWVVEWGLRWRLEAGPHRA
jgi:REP element-mobilizing transposase RayT